MSNNQNDDLSPENPINPMANDFNDPDFNAYDEGPVATAPQKNRRVLLKNVPVGLQRHGLENFLNRFGKIVDLCIPRNQENFAGFKEGFKFVFVEYSNFNAAEQAIRQLNQSQDMNIRAEFAYDRRKEQSDNMVTMVQRPFNEPTATLQTELYRPPITINYNRPSDDVYEKVTQFERKKPLLSDAVKKTTELMKKLAKKSKGSYDEVTKSFVYELADVTFANELCIQCDKYALLKSDLGHYFCSIKCSLAAQKPMIPAPPLDKNQIVYGEPIKVKDKVVVTAVINEKCFYLRRIEDDEIFLMNNVCRLAKHADKLQVPPEIGDLVLARYMDEIYRAKVLAVLDDSTFSVLLIDCGNTARVSIDDLRIMDQKCQSLLCIVHKVLLKDVKCEAINANLISYLSEIVLKKKEVTVKELDENGASLVDDESSVINKRIAELSIVDGEASTHEQGIQLDTLLPLGANKKLFVLNAKLAECPEIFCCVSEKYLKDFYEFYKAINVYATDNYDRIVQENKYGVPYSGQRSCLAFCGEQWHRASVDKVSGDGCPLLTLDDLGVSQKVDVKKIIALPAVFEQTPFFLQICKIEGFDADSSEEVKKKVEELITENSFVQVDEVKESFEGTYSVIIKSICDPKAAT